MGQAYHHAGSAIERTLKYFIMRRYGWNAWPEPTRNRAVYSHDLVFLAQEAGLAEHLALDFDRRSTISQAWLVAKDWKNERRYDPLPFPEALARDMVAVLDDGGLLTWLINR